MSNKIKTPEKPVSGDLNLADKFEQPFIQSGPCPAETFLSDNLQNMFFLL